MDKSSIKKLKGIFSNLANEKRLEIIRLCSIKSKTISELSKEVELTYSITSRYVSDLENAGFLVKKRNSDSSVSVISLVDISDTGEVTFGK